MTSALPETIQKRLSGKIRVDYWKGATLNAEELVSLGVRRCDLNS
jgi:hypothetical protein